MLGNLCKFSTKIKIKTKSRIKIVVLINIYIYINIYNLIMYEKKNKKKNVKGLTKKRKEKEGNEDSIVDCG